MDILLQYGHAPQLLLPIFPSNVYFSLSLPDRQSYVLGEIFPLSIG